LGVEIEHAEAISLGCSCGQQRPSRSTNIKGYSGSVNRAWGAESTYWSWIIDLGMSAIHVAQLMAPETTSASVGNAVTVGYQRANAMGG
jgi:hypothetical protein